MSKEMTVEELREKPQELIDAIDQGEAVTITRDGTAVATMAPSMRTGHQGIPYPFRNFDWGPRPKNLSVDPAQIIIEERERERSGKKYGL